jgi:hypothetical protein
MTFNRKIAARRRIGLHRQIDDADLSAVGRFGRYRRSFGNNCLSGRVMKGRTSMLNISVMMLRVRSLSVGKSGSPQ